MDYGNTHEGHWTCCHTCHYTYVWNQGYREIFIRLFFHQEYAKPVFIYGVKAGGIGLAKSIRNQDVSKYTLVGFVSEVSDIQGRYLMGVRVYPNNEHLVEEMKKRKAHTLLVSPLKTSR